MTRFTSRDKRSTITNSILDILLGDQDSCVGCSSKELYEYKLCHSCYEELELVDKMNILEARHDKEEEFVVYTAAFYNNFLKEMYAPYKFEQKSFYRDSFGEMLVAYVEREIELASCGWITYVPMSPEKEVLRGYNPLGEIARYMAHQLGLPLVHGLQKAKKNKEQNKLNRIQRESNVRGAFALATKKDQFRMENPAGLQSSIQFVSTARLAQSRGILIDDFLTSGNTMREAISVFRSAGLDVVGLTLAMSSYPRD